MEGEDDAEWHDPRRLLGEAPGNADLEREVFLGKFWVLYGWWRGQGWRHEGPATTARVTMTGVEREALRPLQTWEVRDFILTMD